MIKTLMEKINLASEEVLDKDHDEVLFVRINTTNKYILIGTIIVFFFICFDLVMGYYPIIAIDLFFLLIYYYSFKFNKNGKHSIGIPLFTMSTTILAFVPQFFIPYVEGYEYIFLTFVGVPLILIPAEQRKTRILGVLLCVICFFYTKYIFGMNVKVFGPKEITSLFMITISIGMLLAEFRFWEKITLKMRDELIENKAQLIHANQLSNLGIMSGGIAHEINNPLAIISVVSYNMKKQLKKVADDEVRQKIEKALKEQDDAIHRIVTIVNGIRSLSKNSDKEPYKLENVNLLVDEIQTICSNKAANNNIFLEFKPANEDITIHCNRTEIGQVLINVIDNAFEAIKEQNKPWVKISITSKESHVFIEVIDSGEGIPEEIAVKMMTPFFTTKPIGAGTGLGLSLSQKIIARHGGSFYYDRKKENTTFVIELPIVDKDIESVV